MYCFVGDVKKICTALIYLELDGLAQNLQQCAKDSIMRLQKLLPYIWPKVSIYIYNQISISDRIVL